MSASSFVAVSFLLMAWGHFWIWAYCCSCTRAFKMSSIKKKMSSICCLPGFLFSAQIEAQYACFSPVVVIVTNPLLPNRICSSCGLRECSGSGRAAVYHGAACELNSSLRCNSYDLDIWHLNSINVHGILLDIFLEVAKAGHQQCEISVWK